MLTQENLVRVSEWVKALRSGEYKQGQEVLEDKHGNLCCLGVLNKIEGKPTDELHENYSINASLLTELTREGYGSAKSQFVDANDNKRCTFEEIADAIEGFVILGGQELIDV